MSQNTQFPVSVPIRVDALWSDGKTPPAPPTADFSKLKNTAGSQSPWLGGTAYNPPNDIPSAMPEGTHLHWTLPAALRRGRNGLCSRLFGI